MMEYAVRDLQERVHSQRTLIGGLRKRVHRLETRVDQLEAFLRRAQRIAWVAVYCGGGAGVTLLNLQGREAAELIALVLKSLLKPGM